MTAPKMACACPPAVLPPPAGRRALWIVSALVALLWSLPGFALPLGDSGRGQGLYERCLACHALRYNRTGPKHCGLLGRRAGSLPGFDFTRALRDSGIVWTAETLDRFLAAPLEMVPGTAMTYDGLKDARERADLIAFLAEARPGSALCE